MSSRLNSGWPAPSIEVQDWPPGDPISNFQLGKIYILEFIRLPSVVAGRRCPTWRSCRRNTAGAVFTRFRYDGRGLCSSPSKLRVWQRMISCRALDGL